METDSEGEAARAVLLRVPLRAAVGLSGRAAIEVEFPMEAQWVRTPEGDEGSRFVPADLSVGVQLYPLLPRGGGMVRLGAFAGLTLPTGPSGGEPIAVDEVGAILRTGSGTVDPLLGLDAVVFTRSIAYVTAFARARLPLYANADGYRRGVTVTEAVELGLRHPTGRFLVQFGLEGLHAASDRTEEPEGHDAEAHAHAAAAPAPSGGLPAALPLHGPGEVHDGRRHEVAFTGTATLLAGRRWALSARLRVPFVRFAGEPQVMSPVDGSLSMTVVVGRMNAARPRGEDASGNGAAPPPGEAQAGQK